MFYSTIPAVIYCPFMISLSCVFFRVPVKRDAALTCAALREYVVRAQASAVYKPCPARLNTSYLP